jgi:hypothetical protein
MNDKGKNNDKEKNKKFRFLVDKIKGSASQVKKAETESKKRSASQVNIQNTQSRERPVSAITPLKPINTGNVIMP